jgi:hypothetical protein
MTRRPLLTLLTIWLAWVIILPTFQIIAHARADLKRPDFILPWTNGETETETLVGRPYLIEPVLNYQVAWDSEYYLSIATVGYDDPNVGTAPPPWQTDFAGHPPVSLNYAFFPFYPLVMRVVRIPLQALGQNPIATSAIAGVAVSLLGALAAMVALYDLTRDELEEAGGLRAAFYLIAFPTGFFLAMVHTEGLFIGLAFSSLALLRRQQWIGAALLAMCATWTRAVGIALVIPLALAWFQSLNLKTFSWRPFPWNILGTALLVLSPLVAYAIWRSALGTQFDFVETSFFGRGPFQWGSLQSWHEAYSVIVMGKAYHPLVVPDCWQFPVGVTLQNRLYYLFEFLATAFGLIACLLTLRRYPGPALFGLAVLIISFTSGNNCVAQGMPRYVLAVPSIFILLARWGRHPAFDRAWTLASVLLLALLTLLFTFNFWVG